LDEKNCGKKIGKSPAHPANSLPTIDRAASEEALFAAYDAFWIEQVLHNLVGNALVRNTINSPPLTHKLAHVVDCT